MIELIQRRLDSYNAAGPVEEEQAIKEILQEIALYALWRVGFFDVAAFQGGTSLRILHKLPRFSEDFILKKPNPEFEWSGY
jgi:predicted nucleotidyltransferase component of viral defense system